MGVGVTVGVSAGVAVDGAAVGLVSKQAHIVHVRMHCLLRQRRQQPAPILGRGDVPPDVADGVGVSVCSVAAVG